MAITGYHHIGLYTQDAQRSLRFYEALGGKPVLTFTIGGNRTITMVEMAPGAVVEIIPAGKEEAEQNARWGHIALATDDCRAAYAAALEAGAKERTPPQEGSLGGVMNKINAFVYGPDGEAIEFFQVL